MNLLLDTTIQIDRITGSKERKNAVAAILQDHRLFCSTYVKGEFYSRIDTKLLEAHLNNSTLNSPVHELK